MDFLKKLYGRLPLIFCFLIAIAFSIKNLREPDLWWQIRTGEWILQHGQVPKQDVFSYTFSGTAWINIKWGFEVLVALFTKAAGPESVFIIQALVSCFILVFLIKIAALQGQQKADALKPLNQASLILALIFTLLAMEYRIIGRPEMFSHLFLVVFLYLLLRHRKEPSNKIWWLIPLQIVWANFHEAFAIGPILIFIFCTGSWLEFYLGQKKKLALKTALPKTISLVLIASLASLVVNPNGSILLSRPFNIMGQVYENKFTTELADFRSQDYWQWNVYLTIALLLLGLAGTCLYYHGLKIKSGRIKLWLEQTGLGYLLILPAFFFLALTAYRNIIFLVLVFFPLLVTGLNALFGKVSALQKYGKQLLLLIGTLQIAVYLCIITNRYYEMTGSHDRFGLEVTPTNNPMGAAEYVNHQHLQGKCFSDYLTSSYLLWKLQPEFKSFIDLRDLDVFPQAFFSTFAEAVTYPESFQQQDSVHHFKYVVLYRPQFSGLHDYLFNQSRFKLVFVDAVAAVYVPRNSDSDSSKVLEFAKTAPVNQGLARAINFLLNPCFKYTDVLKVDYDLLAAGFYINLGKLDEAEGFAKKAATNGIENYKGLEMQGEVLYSKALLPVNTTAARESYLEEAKKAYESAISMKDDFSAAYYGLGAVCFQQKNMTVALDYFQKSIALDKTNLNAYLFAAGCCNYFVNQNGTESNAYAGRAIAFYEDANRLNPDNPEIMMNLGFLYFRLNDCKNSSMYLKRVVDFQGLSQQQQVQARICLQKCGS